METDILLKSIHVQTHECLICYESNAIGFQCINCMWQHCDECHKNWTKQSKTCPQCRMVLDIDSNDEEQEKEETNCCKKLFFIACLYAMFVFLLLYVICIILLAGDATLDCSNDLWCFFTNLLMFLFLVACSVQVFVKLVIYYQA